MAKLILISGPPRSGKDTMADIFSKEHNFWKEKFAKPLEDGLRGFFGLASEPYRIWRNEKKEQVYPPAGVSFRKAMQTLSEEWAKPTMGSDIFGRLAADRLLDPLLDGIRRFVFSDCGFTAECLPVMRHFHPDEIHLVRIYREGCSFLGDTRDYPDISCFKPSNVHDLNNTDGMVNMLDMVQELVEAEE